MSNQPIQHHSRVRRWLRLNAYFDAIFALRERTVSALHQILNNVSAYMRRSRGQKSRSSYHLEVERLEVREVMSTTTWTGGGSDNNWTTYANWDNGIPSQYDTAVINNPSFTVNLPAGYLYDVGSFSLSAGAISGSGVLHVIGTGLTSIWSGGTISDSQVWLEGGRDLDIDGDVTVDGAYITVGGLFTWVSGDITITNDGFFSPTDTDVECDASIIGSSGGVFYSYGDFRKVAGSGTTEIQSDFTAVGDVDEQTGSILFSDGLVWLQGGTVTGAEFDGADITIGTGGENLDSVTISSGTVDLNGNGFVFDGTSTWSGGSIEGSGGFWVAEGATLNISGSGSKQLTDASFQNVGGTVNWSGGDISIDNSDIINGTDGSFTMADGCDLTDASVDSTFTNYGTLVVSGISDDGINQLAVDFAQATGGTLFVELKQKSGNQFDRVQFGGFANLYGTIKVRSLAGYSVAIGDDFTILTSSTLDIGDPKLDVGGFDGKITVARYGSTSVTLIAIGETVATSATISPDGPPSAGNTIPAVGGYGVNLQNGNLHVNAAASNVPLFYEQDLVYYYGGLQYNSNTASPQPIIMASVQPSASEGVPTGIDATLTWNGVGQSPVSFGIPGGVSAGTELFFSLQVANPVTATGKYSYRIDYTISYASSALYGTIIEDTVVIVNGATPYGHGWAPADSNYLVVDGADVILAYPDGGWTYFTASGGSFTSPYDLGTLTQPSPGVYVYTDKDNLVWNYASTSGDKILLDSVVDPNGLRVTYTYSGDKLSYVRNPNDTGVTFTYSGDQLQSIKRGYYSGGSLQVTATATVTYDGSDNLDTFTDAESNVRTFTYDANHKMTSDSLGSTLTSFAYANGAVSSVSQGGGLYDNDVAPQLAQGLGANAVPASALAGDVTDGENNTWHYKFDAQGRLVGRTLATSATESWTNNDAGLPLTHTDELGQTTSFTYDSDGRLTSIETPDSAITTFVYSTTYNTPTTIIDSDGNRTTNTLDGAGNLLNSVNSNNERTTFTYGTSSTAGLVVTMVDSNNLTTSYTYNNYRLLETIKTPDNAITTFVYDLANRTVSVISPTGERTTQVFDKLGQMVASQDASGQITTSTYAADGNPSASVDTFGNTTTTTYDAAGLPAVTIDQNNNRTTMTRDDAGRVKTVKDSNNNVTTFMYDANGRRTVVIDRYDHRTTTVYDARGNVSATIDVYGNQTTFAYDNRGRQTGVTDPYGNRTTSVFDKMGRVTASTDQYGHTTTYVYSGKNLTTTIDWLNHRTTYTYTANNKLESTLDAFGNRTTLIYDAYNRQTETIDPDGNRTTTVFDAAGRVSAQVDMFGNRTTFHYDAAGRQESIEDRYGHFTTTVYDALGRVSATIDVFNHRTTTLYNSNGQGETQIDTLGNRTTTTYYADGNVKETINALNQRTTFLYDGSGRQYVTIDALSNRTTTIFDASGRVEAVANALGRTTNVYDAYGRVEAVIDARNNRTSTIFDNNGRVSEQIDQLGNRTTFLYDGSGRQYVTIDPLGNRTTTVFDNDGRVSAVIDALNHRTTTVYDNDGRVSENIDYANNRTTFLYDSRSRQETTINPDSTRVTNVFDSRGRIQAVIDRLGNRTTTVWDSSGRYEATIDTLGNRTTVAYDSYGRQVATIDQLSNRTTTVLDDLGRRVNLIDASSNKTTFVYDALGRVNQEIDPLGDSTTFAYDAVGRLSSRTDRLGRRIDYGYDALGHKTTETWYDADGSTVNNRATFTYDANGNMLTAKDGNGTYTLTYDAANRVSVVNDVWGKTLTFTYDAVGRRTRVQDSDGGTTTSTYNAIGQLTRRDFSDGETPLRIDFTYDEYGRIALITRYSNLAGTATVATTDTTYNLDGNVTNIHHKDATPSTMANLTFTFDAKGRLATQNDGTLTTYTHDSTDQQTADGTTTVTYDATGNRNNGSYTIGTGNRMTADATWTYTYNDEGNMTKKSMGGSSTTWKYVYDNKNHLTQAKKWSEDPDYPGTAVLQLQADYKYDVFGNRIEKSVDSDGAGAGSAVVTRFALDGWNPAKSNPIGVENFDVWAKLDGSSSLTSREIQGDGVDEHLARIESSTAYWYLNDHLGSIRKVIDNSATVRDAITYDGYGKITSESDSTKRGLYSWTGRELDAETQLQYNRARYYDANTGRWISQDPLGFDASDNNIYRYSRNGYTLQLDPSGLFATANKGDVPFGQAQTLNPTYAGLAPKPGTSNLGISTSYKVEMLDLFFTGSSRRGTKGSPNVKDTIVPKLIKDHKNQNYWVIVASSAEPEQPPDSIRAIDGHSWIALVDTKTATILSKGFYSSGSPTPTAPETKGHFEDDSETRYKIARAYPVTKDQYVALTQKLNDLVAKPPNYHLGSNNCTTVVCNFRQIEIQAIQINLFELANVPRILVPRNLSLHLKANAVDGSVPFP